MGTYLWQGGEVSAQESTLICKLLIVLGILELAEKLLAGNIGKTEQTKTPSSFVLSFAVTLARERHKGGKTNGHNNRVELQVLRDLSEKLELPLNSIGSKLSTNLLRYLSERIR